MGPGTYSNTEALIQDCSRKDTVIEELLGELQKLRNESQASAAVVAAVTQNEMAAAQESKRMADMTQAQLREVSMANDDMASKMNAVESEKHITAQRCPTHSQTVHRSVAVAHTPIPWLTGALS